ncbi:MAG: gliding motility-associated protein GldE [Saprospiraceae bacterium]
MDLEPPPELLYFSLTFVLQMSEQMPFLLIVFGILLICSGLISASEVAFFSLDINEVKALESEKSAHAKKVLDLKAKPRNLLAVILIANNLVNIGIILIADNILKIALGDQLLLNAGEWLTTHLFQGAILASDISDVLNFMITIIGVTFILLIFGEAGPKMIATYNKHAILRIMVGPLAVMDYLFRPISSSLVKMSKFIEARINTHNNHTSKEDIDTAIDLIVTNTENATQEADILKGIVSFGDTSARQIMHTRTDVVAVDVRDNFKELLKIVKDSGYSRLPVFKDDFDEILGILYVKDILEHLDKDENFEWQKLIRNNVLFVPESKKIDELLREFQIKKTHMAIVVDEYGGSAGIATLEDIMEEVVGDIKDEFDNDEDVDYKKISESHFIFDGKTLLKDVCRVVGISTSFFDEIKTDTDSVAGIFLEKFGAIPEVGQEMSHNHITLRVDATSKRRIERISVLIEQVLI